MLHHKSLGEEIRIIERLETVIVLVWRRPLLLTDVVLLAGFLTDASIEERANAWAFPETKYSYYDTNLHPTETHYCKIAVLT